MFALRLVTLAVVALLLFGAPEPASAGDAHVEEERILYFASFSMPEGSLRKAIEQGAKVGAVFVLRGAKNDSFMDTARAVKDLMGDKNVAFQIDPPLFREYGVTEVPCVCYRGLKICGDVSLDCALEAIAAQEPSAEKHVKKLREGFYDR